MKLTEKQLERLHEQVRDNIKYTIPELKGNIDTFEILLYRYRELLDKGATYKASDTDMVGHFDGMHKDVFDINDTLLGVCENMERTVAEMQKCAKSSTR